MENPLRILQGLHCPAPATLRPAAACREARIGAPARPPTAPLREAFAERRQWLATLAGRGVEGLLYGMLVFMPFALGVVAPWSERLVFVAAAAIALLLLIKRAAAGGSRAARFSVACRGRSRPRRRAIHLGVCSHRAVRGAGRLSAASPAGGRCLGPLAADAGHAPSDLLSDLPAGDSLLKTLTLSFYPPATRHDLRLVLLAAVIFAAVLDGFRSPRQIRRLLTVIAAVGGAVPLLALLQDMTAGDLVYWTIPSPTGRANSGPVHPLQQFRPVHQPLDRRSPRPAADRPAGAPRVGAATSPPPAFRRVRAGGRPLARRASLVAGRCGRRRDHRPAPLAHPRRDRLAARLGRGRDPAGAARRRSGRRGGPSPSSPCASSARCSTPASTPSASGWPRCTRAPTRPPGGCRFTRTSPGREAVPAVGDGAGHA